MPSGNKSIIINTRERVISTDLNRMQAFAAADVAEFVRHLMMSETNEFLSSGIADPYPATQIAPPGLLVAGGLLPQPEIGSTGISCSAGVAYVIAPETPASPEDSPAKLVNDPGVALGTLALTPNASGSTRIDVYEVSVVDMIIETSNRDIYNQSSGLFAPATVNKVRKSFLQHRIRTGTPGTGFPGIVSGWVPFMVASVPTGTTTWDTVTCWDVRALASDIAIPGFNRCNAQYADREIHGRVIATGTPSLVMHGRYKSVCRWWKAGGFTPTAGFDLIATYGETPTWYTAIANVSAEYSGKYCWYVYACFPFGLPRWCRYRSLAEGGRFPGGFRGIPVATTKAPSEEGFILTEVGLPAAYGLGGATCDTGVCIFASAANVQTVSLSPVYLFAEGLTIGDSSLAAEEGWISNTYGFGLHANSVAYAATMNVAHTMDDGSAWPTNAKEVKFQIEITYYTGAVEHGHLMLQMFDDLDGGASERVIVPINMLAPGNAKFIAPTMRMAIPSHVGDTPGPVTRQMRLRIDAKGLTGSSSSLDVIVWTTGVRI